MRQKRILDQPGALSAFAEQFLNDPVKGLPEECRGLPGLIVQGADAHREDGPLSSQLRTCSGLNLRRPDLLLSFEQGSGLG